MGRIYLPWVPYTGVARIQNARAVARGRRAEKRAGTPLGSLPERGTREAIPDGSFRVGDKKNRGTAAEDQSIKARTSESSPRRDRSIDRLARQRIARGWTEQLFRGAKARNPHETYRHYAVQQTRLNCGEKTHRVIGHHSDHPALRKYYTCARACAFIGVDFTGQASRYRMSRVVRIPLLRPYMHAKFYDVDKISFCRRESRGLLLHRNQAIKLPSLPPSRFVRKRQQNATSSPLPASYS